MPRRLLGEPGSNDDDRQDGDKRDRIDELVSSLLTWQEAVDARAKRVVVLVILAVVLAFCAVLGCLALLHRVDTQATHNQAALCALRGELVHRVSSSQDFLAKNPNGALGFSRAQIKKSIRDSQSSIQALNVADC